MFEFLLVTYGVLFFFVVNTAYALFVAPIIGAATMNAMFNDDEDEIDVSKIVDEVRKENPDTN